MFAKKRLAFLVSCFLLFSGCSQTAAQNQTTVSKPAPDFAPLTEIHPKQKNLYLIVKNLDSNYWKVIIEGAKVAGETFGCNIYYSGTYAETNWTEQQELLETCIERDADAVLLAPDDSVMLAQEINKVNDASIPVILVDTTANTDAYKICYMTDNLKAGQDAAAEMISQLRKRGISETEQVEIGIQVGATSSQTINERLAGFFQYWAQNAPEEWKIIPDIKCNEGDAEQAVVCAEELLDQHPDICGVFGSNNGSTVGFAKIVQERSRTDVTIVGFDYSDEIAALIQDPAYSASTMLQRQYDMSQLGVSAALDCLDGKALPMKFVDTGVIVVNADTFSLPEVQEVLQHN